MNLLKSIGEPLTLQIELKDISGVEHYLASEFNDSRNMGFFSNNLIIIQHSNEVTDYSKILNSLIDIIADIDSIDCVTALVSVNIGENQTIETSVQIDDSNNPPHILATADSSLYFQIANAIQLRWNIGKQMTSR